MSTTLTHNNTTSPVNSGDIAETSDTHKNLGVYRASDTLVLATQLAEQLFSEFGASDWATVELFLNTKEHASDRARVHEFSRHGLANDISERLRAGEITEKTAGAFYLTAYYHASAYSLAADIFEKFGVERWESLTFWLDDTLGTLTLSELAEDIRARKMSAPGFTDMEPEEVIGFYVTAAEMACDEVELY